MAKVIIVYDNEIERIKILEVLAKGLKIKRLHRLQKNNKTKKYRCCIEIE